MQPLARLCGRLALWSDPVAVAEYAGMGMAMVADLAVGGSSEEWQCPLGRGSHQRWKRRYVG